MDVGVVLFVDVDQRLDDLPRPLRRGGVVEIDQRHVVVQPRRQDRKIGPQPGHVERSGTATDGSARSGHVAVGVMICGPRSGWAAGRPGGE